LAHEHRPAHAKGTGRPDVIAVLSAERTGGTAVAESLRALFPRTGSLHVHYLARPKRGPFDDQEDRVQAAKQATEARVRAQLADPDLDRMIVTVVRNPVDRIISTVWYLRGGVLSALYDPGRDAFDPRAGRVLVKMLRSAVALDRSYPADVFLPLGLSERPEPGRRLTPDGAEVFVLRHEALEADFRAMTTAVFGYPVQLRRVNGAELYGDAGIYLAFRRFARPYVKRALGDGLQDQGAAPPPRFGARDLRDGRRPLGDHPIVKLKRRALAAEREHDAQAQCGAWRETLRLDPDDLQAHVRLAQLHAEQRDHAGAAAHLRAIALAQPNAAKPWKKLADCFMAAGDRVGELDARRTVLALEPDDYKLRARVRTLLLELGRAQEALEEADRLRVALSGQTAGQ
jgi:tetratricopeptide (TPR) repeat protein